MAADGERLDERELVIGKFFGRVHFPRGQKDALGHAAVAHDAEGFVGLAAIGEAASAGVAVAAVDVGLHGAAVAGRDVRDARADGEHLDTQLVAGDARVAEEGHLAEVAGDVRAADADAMDAEKDFAGGGRGGFGDVDASPGFGLFELKGFHVVCRGREVLVESRRLKQAAGQVAGQ